MNFFSLAKEEEKEGKEKGKPFIYIFSTKQQQQ